MLTTTNTRDEVRSPELRGGEPLVNPLRRIVRLWGYWTLVVGPGLGLGLTPFGGEAAAVGWIVGGIFLAVMLITTLALAWYAGRIDRRLRAFQEGDCLVHWTYTEDEWQGFARLEWEHRQRSARGAFYLSLGLTAFTCLVVGIAAAAALFKDQASAYVLGALIGAASGAGIGALLGWIIAAGMRRNGRRRLERMCQQVGEAYIGRDAAYCTGDYCTWKTFGASLHKIALLDGKPSRLEFTVRYANPKGGNMDQTSRIPVPAGNEQEAREVIRALTGIRA